MMSQNSEGEKSFLSPVKVHSQRHGAGNLTGHPRKVKDLAADFHNYIMKWEALNAQGMDIVIKIANIKIEKVFDVQEDGSTTSALPNELNPLCESLSEVVESMDVENWTAGNQSEETNLVKNESTVQSIFTVVDIMRERNWKSMISIRKPFGYFYKRRAQIGK